MAANNFTGFFPPPPPASSQRNKNGSFSSAELPVNGGAESPAGGVKPVTPNLLINSARPSIDMSAFNTLQHSLGSGSMANGNKYNHLTHYQQLNDRNKTLAYSNPQIGLLPSANNSFGPYFPYQKPGFLNMPPNTTVAAAALGSLSSQPAAVPMGSMLSQSTSFIYNKNTQPSSRTPTPTATGAHMFPASEQEMLDKGFLNLLDKEKANQALSKLNGTAPTSLFNINSNHSRSSPAITPSVVAASLPTRANEQNLIEFDSDFNEMSVADLFDPLVIRENQLMQLKAAEKSSKEAATPAVAAPTTAAVKSETKTKRNSISMTKENSKNKPSEEKTPNRQNGTSTNGSEQNESKKAAKPAEKPATAKKPSIPKKNSVVSLPPVIKTPKKIKSFSLVESMSSEDFDDFNSAVNALSRQVNVEKKQLTDLVVFSPLLECPLLHRGAIKMVIKYQSQISSHHDVAESQLSSSPNRRAQITISPALNATIETIVYEILTSFNIDDLDPSKYLLKIHGLEEYLPIEATLAELKYIHECLVEGKDPVLLLVERRNANTELSDANASGPEVESPFKFSVANLIDRNDHLLNKSTLETFVNGLVQNRNAIEDSIQTFDNDNYAYQLETALNLSVNLKEKLKRLIAHVFSVHFSSIAHVIERLEFGEKSLRQYTNTRYREKQPLMSMMNGNASSDSLQFIFTSLIETANDALTATFAFISSAASSFNWPYKIVASYFDSDGVESGAEYHHAAGEDVSDTRAIYQDYSIVDKKEIIQSDDKVAIDFKSLSRLSFLLTGLASTINPSNELYLRFSICFGSRILDSVVVRLDKMEKFFQRKTDYFTTAHTLKFDRIDVCLLPREAILLIQLCVTPTLANFNMTTLNLNNSIIVSSAASSLTNTLDGENHGLAPNEKCVAWGSRTLFDDNLSLRKGDYLLCLFPGDMPQICTSTSNIFNNKYPIVQLVVSNKNKGVDLVYPDTSYDYDCVTRDFHTLPVDIKDRLLQICNKSLIATKLTEDEKDLIHEYYVFLNGIPNALGKIYLSFRSWDFSAIIHFNAFLKQCDTLTLAESLELLLPMFPTYELRNHAVRSLLNCNAETVSLYLPQLLEALKYERTHNSPLARMLLIFSAKNIRFAHKLYWQLREFKSRENDCMFVRYEIISRALISFFSRAMVSEIEQEVFLVNRIDQIAKKMKETKENDKLHNELDGLSSEWPLVKKGTGSCRLPYDLSYCVRDIDVKLCSIISSFTMPLKLVFRNFDNTANNFYTIYKIGDDLRQDMFVLQLINVMNQLWIMEGLDLNVLTFACLQTSSRRGFIEMITNAETLKEIQKGVAINVFKRSCINEWLKSHNPNPVNFRKAIRNFTRSCAAYSVATYILGIGDRHNDNIMVKYTGHMFHIDFGKYLGDAQTFAGFKRDRTPILFTPDMFFVINQAKDANERFQQFIEIATRAFQILRKNFHHLLTLIEIMIDSGIPGLNKSAIQFVYKNLMIDMSEDDSSNAFKKLVFDSLSTFTLFNFAIHTLAQPKTTNSSNMFSFITHTSNAQTDGKIVSITLENNAFNNANQSTELFKCMVTRENEFESHEVYRNFEEFCELYQQLVKTFPALVMEQTIAFNKFKDTKQFAKRRQLIDSFIKDLMSLQAEISQSDIIYTFFHPILRDQKGWTEPTMPVSESLQEIRDDPMLKDIMIDNNDDANSDTYSYSPDIRGQIRVKLKFKDNKFYVTCLQCRNLRAPNSSASSLKPYVKCYLRPDLTKATKQKVQALYNGANPIFTETMEYDIYLNELRNRTLEISVLNSKLNSKDRIGSVEIRLYDINWNTGEFVKWFDLR